MLILVVNYNQLHFFGLKKQLIKNTSSNENPQIEKLMCVAYIVTVKIILTYSTTNYHLSKKRKDTVQYVFAEYNSKACNWGGVRRIGGLFRGNTWYWICLREFYVVHALPLILVHFVLFRICSAFEKNINQRSSFQLTPHHLFSINT